MAFMSSTITLHRLQSGVQQVCIICKVSCPNALRRIVSGECHQVKVPISAHFTHFTENDDPGVAVHADRQEVLEHLREVLID